MGKTKIEWCDMTVNPVVGCTYGCEYCYARRMNERFGWIENFSRPEYFPERLEQLSTKTQKKIFINSMSDIADWGHDAVEDVYKRIWEHRFTNTTGKAKNIYLALTKRPEKLRQEQWLRPDNLWIGQTITGNQPINKFVDFLSIEPLLGPVHLDNLLHIHLGFPVVKWVIIGAETGNRKGKIIPKKEWVDEIVNDCRKLNIPVFMKNSLLPIMGNVVTEFPEFDILKILKGGE